MKKSNCQEMIILSQCHVWLMTCSSSFEQLLSRRYFSPSAMLHMAFMFFSSEINWCTGSIFIHFMKYFIALPILDRVSYSTDEPFLKTFQVRKKCLALLIVGLEFMFVMFVTIFGFDVLLFSFLTTLP